jgi:hypothetical protein
MHVTARTITISRIPNEVMVRTSSEVFRAYQRPSEINQEAERNGPGEHQIERHVLDPCTQSRVTIHHQDGRDACEKQENVKHDTPRCMVRRSTAAPHKEDIRVSCLGIKEA